MEFYKLIAVVVLFFLLAFLSYGFFFSSAVPQTSPFSFSSSLPDCATGAVRQCVKSSCNGTEYCVNGEWSSCTLEDVCKPGKHYPCEGTCSSGYRVCNNCGTGYEVCIID